MNHKFLQLSKILAYCFVLIFTLLVTNTNAQLVTNGSFESSDTTIVDSTDIEGWLLQYADSITPPPVFKIVDDTVEQGNRALKVTVGGLGINDYDIQAVADSIPVTPGVTYNYSIWAKAENPSAQVNFTVGNYSNSEYEAIRPQITTQWKKYTMQFTITDNETVIRAPINFGYSGNVNNPIYIDNLRIAGVNAGKTPVEVEAESGELGSYFSVMQAGGVSYITTDSNYTGFTPGDTSRIATYQVTFQDSGTYDLFVRLRVGPNGYNDDSFFYGRGFGAKNDTASADWAFINGLAAAGFSNSDDIVRDAGTLGSQVWKWVNLSRNAYQGSGIVTFTVDEDSLTQTFQIGSREDGLDFDKIAFGKSYLYFTVGNLDNGEPGSLNPGGEGWGGPPLASNQPKFVGSAYSVSQANNFEAYWNQVTPENAGKWGRVEGTRDNMNWSELDSAYNLAKNNSFPFNFHVLIGGEQQPTWIDTLKPADQLDEIRQWFQAIATRYPDIDYLQVVDGPLPGHNPPDGANGRANYKEALGGDGETGWDWVINAFQMAREIFPSGTKLMLNDYDIINSSSNNAQYLSLIRLLQSKDLIDVIGVQGHAFSTNTPVVTMRKYLDSLATTGLPIQVTEMDIDGPSDAIQLQDYQRIFPALYEHPDVEGITLWGWRPGLWRNEQGAFIIDQYYSERPALTWLRDYLDTINISPVSVKDISESPKEFHLYNNYPNPFNPTTHIKYSISRRGFVSLKVYNILGKEVVVLYEGEQDPGNYVVTFDASGLASGVYFYRLQSDNFVDTKKLMILK